MIMSYSNPIAILCWGFCSTVLTGEDCQDKASKLFSKCCGPEWYPNTILQTDIRGNWVKWILSNLSEFILINIRQIVPSPDEQFHYIYSFLFNDLLSSIVFLPCEYLGINKMSCTSSKILGHINNYGHKILMKIGSRSWQWGMFLRNCSGHCNT